MTAQYRPPFEKWRHPSAEEAFFRLLAVALIACVASDMVNGVWNIHAGVYYPWRHNAAFPLFPAPYLLLEWGLLLLASAFIFSLRRRQGGVVIAAVMMLISLTQRFSNHRSLIFIVLLYLCIPGGRARGESQRLIRYQLIIVYLFSALNKLNRDFLEGHTLANLGWDIHGALLPTAAVRWILSPNWSMPLSYVVVAIELLMPILLIRQPRIGFTVALLMHTLFSLVMPGIWAFTFIMLAMACLFLPNRVYRSRRSSRAS
jgi:hypothetical protein